MFSPKHEVSAVVGFLRSRFADVAEVETLGTGEWSQAYSFRARDQDLVIRLGQFAEDYEKDRRAAGFAARDLPIPQLHEIGEALGGVYAISSRAFGKALDGLDESGYRRVFPSLLRSLDALRCVDVSGSTGYGMWRPEGSAPYASWREALLDVENDRKSDRIHGWGSRLARVPTAVETFREGYRHLHRLVDACPEGRHLIHADLVGDNVRVQGERVTAIVDWGNSMYGDFLYDLARFSFWSPWFPELERIDLLGLAREHYASIGLAVPDLAARLCCYQVHIGLDAQAYNAFTGRWGELERSGRRTLDLAGRV